DLVADVHRALTVGVEQLGERDHALRLAAEVDERALLAEAHDPPAQLVARLRAALRAALVAAPPLFLPFRRLRLLGLVGGKERGEVLWLLVGTFSHGVLS